MSFIPQGHIIFKGKLPVEEYLLIPVQVSAYKFAHKHGLYNTFNQYESILLPYWVNMETQVIIQMG